MATVVRYEHGMLFCSDLESGRVTCDAFSEKGKKYPSAPELLMVSLGSCIGAVILTYSDRHGINYEGMEISLDWQLAHHPYRIGRIDVTVHMPGPLTPEQTEILKRVADQCLIHATLLNPPEINLDLHVAQPAPAALRPFDRLRVAPSNVEGRQAQDRPRGRVARPERSRGAEDAPGTSTAKEPKSP